MELNSIKPAEGSKHAPRRVGRGIGSGLGKTAGRGHKGQKSRSGGYHKVGFEGGQMPLQRRVPKFGFKNRNRVEYKGINVDTIQELVERKALSAVTPEVLVQNGLASKRDLIKILGRGELMQKVDVTAHKFSASAQQAIEAQGGSVTTL